MTRLSLLLLVFLAGCSTVAVTGTPLEKAISRGDAKEVEALLRGGVDPNRKDLLTRISPACRAVRAHHLEVLKLLLDHGANILKESDALYCAVDTGQLDFVKFLLDRGAPIGPYALLRAQEHQPEILAYLREVQDQRKAPKPAAPLAPVLTPAVVTVATVPFSVPTRPADAAVIVTLGARADALATSAYANVFGLGYPPDKILELTGGGASLASLVKTIEGKLPQVVKDSSTVFFYFAGKAVSKNGQDYLLPSDGDPAFLEETAYPVSRLLERLGALHARLAVVVLDAGVTLAGTPPPALYAVAASTAAKEGEFSQLFFDGLAGAAKGANDVVTLGSLADFIAARSAAPSALPSRQRLAEVVLH